MTFDSSPYTPQYYDLYRRGSRRSAEVVVGLVFELVRPLSVVDFGCGVGAWLAIALERGAEEVCGLDGPWTAATELEIPEESFIPCDLTQPVDLDRRFDLALCVEVAEHLPEESAATLVRSLTLAAPVVLFSAAIPGQGGVDHVNEQWPDYWATLFRAFDFVSIDCLRRALWVDERVEASYRQNLLLYVRRTVLPRFRDHVPSDPQSGDPLPLVHPRVFELAVSHARAQLPEVEAARLRSVVPFAARVAAAASRRRFNRFLRLAKGSART